MSDHTPGNSIYRAAEIAEKIRNIRTFRPKKISVKMFMVVDPFA